jgi:signal transduction histidine kinase
VRRLWVLARRHGLDLLVVLAALEAAREVVVSDLPDAPRSAAWFAAPAVAAMGLALLARRRLPFAAPALLWILGAAASFVDGRLVTFSAATFVAGMAASLLLGQVRDERKARIGLAIVLGGAATVVYNDPAVETGSLLFTPVLMGICWLAGFALRERADTAEAAEERAAQAEHEREAAARLAVAEERARIARELHDVVAHAVSVMVLQVGAVRHGMPDALGESKRALEGVERTGRTAMTEMRHVLSAMRDGDEPAERAPQPGLDGLEALAESVGRAGLPVRVRVEGDPVPLPRPIDLSAYRVVQEGLTNALKHARAGRADVRVRYGADDVLIEVSDDGTGGAAGDGLGHGLVGLRERVSIYGGEMTAGAGAGGGFVLSTRLPLTGGGG